MRQPDDYTEIKETGSPYDSLIQTASTNYGVPYDLLHKQLFKESSFNPNAVSPTGPRGIGQFTKATGKAYGLITDEDFFDPTKSIDAAARHMRDNLKASNGDELKALLMYNQGAGPVGRKQLEAYDRGDFTGVSEEGLGYMRTLMDVTNTGKRAELDAFAKLGSGFEAPADIEVKPKAVPGAAPDSLASFNLVGTDVAPKATPFAQELYETTGKTDDDDRGFFEGAGNNAGVSLKTSMLGMMLRSVTENPEADFSQQAAMLSDVFNDPLNGVDRMSDWTDEDYDKLRSSGLDPQFYDVVLRGYRRNFDQNLSLALENQQMIQSTQSDRLGAALVGTGGAIIGDPYSLVNPGRAAGGGLFARITAGALAGGAVGGLSEHSGAKVSGREEHLGMAIAGGAAFGGVLNGAFGARPAAELSANPLDNLMAPHDFVDLMNGTTARLERREMARLDGLSDDPTAMPYREGDEIKEGVAGEYMDVPWDEGAARTKEGSILSGGNPLNPKTLDAFTELESLEAPRASVGVRLGSLTEIGLALGRSKNPETRGLAADLFRSSTGYQDGSNGKFGATASDIAERLRSQDNITHNKLADGFHEALKDPYWRAQDMSEGAKRDLISQRVVEALEAQKPAKLTPAEMKLLEELKAHMNQKWDYISNPAQFGDLRAKPLLEDTRHYSAYFPQRYNSAAKLQALQRFGGEEGLQEAIAHSWLASYMSRTHVKQRVDAMIKEAHERANKGNPEAKPMTPEELQAAVEKYANDKAYGISHSDRFTADSLVEEHLKDGAGLENNDYLEARNLFDSDMAITAPDGQPFAVNDLRDFNLLRVVPQYDRRVNGDIALMGGTGKDTRTLKNMVNGMRQRSAHGEDAREAEYLMDALKMLTGRARRDPDGTWATVARSLNDIGFATKNAYMGAQNITEAASLVVKGHQRMLLKGIPMLKKLATANSKLELDDIKQMHDLIFGKELDDIIRPTRQDIVDNLRRSENSTASQVAGTLKFATGEIAARSPFTWLLRESGNYIMDAGRQGALVDLIDHTLNGKVTNLFSPERLRSASITDEQFAGIHGLIREHFKQDKKTGKWRIENPSKLASDTRAMDLYRLGDRVADETMLRPHKMSFAPSKQYGAGWAMALQFKMFVLRSLNGRMARGWMETTKNGQALDQVMQAIVSVGLATAFYAASAHLRALGMPERARKAYLDKALNPDMLAYAAISRSSHVGAPMGTANFLLAPLGFDQAAMVRTSILPRGERKDSQGIRPIKYNPLQSDAFGDFAGRVAEQVPAINMLAYGAQAGYSGWNVAKAERGVDLKGHRTGLWNALRQFVPNDPVTQNLMMRIAQEQGVDRTR
ncbi:Transglycosylase SLT domain-containing protein [Pseudomonas sp. NFACC19-2]|nr:transglycosylase SLT domain-containing protein [Pseudomonas sp. NFACC19-2]SFW31810.1 Transglycosylase SLT domain-containing protein [Pseudomonas sp. NFACC19-2]